MGGGGDCHFLIAFAYACGERIIGPERRNLDFELKRKRNLRSYSSEQIIQICHQLYKTCLIRVSLFYCKDSADSIYSIAKDGEVHVKVEAIILCMFVYLFKMCTLHAFRSQGLPTAGDIYICDLKVCRIEILNKKTNMHRVTAIYV